MDEQQFWQIIARLDWSQKNSLTLMQPAIEALAQFDLESLQQFDEILAAKLYALDTQAHAQPTGFGVEHFSVDTFLYNRCAVVASGRDFYEQVLQNPDLMLPNGYFEGVLYLAYYAALQKGIQDYDYLSQISYETFSNEDGWKNADFPDGLPPGHLPQHQRK